MRDPTVESAPEQYDQHSANHKGSIQWVSCQHHKGKTVTHCHYAYISYCLVIDPENTPHMSAHHNTRSCSPLKTVLGKIRDQYQAYCTTYKTHAMATCNRGAGCLLDRGLDILTEDTEHTDINNSSTHSSDITVVLGDPDAVGHTEDPTCDSQDRLTTLTREINDLHQRVAMEEGQPTETLDHIQQELQNLSIAIHQPQPPAPAESLGEVLHQYTDTLCSTQKQSKLTNSLMKDIPVLMNMTPPSWKIGSLTLKQQQTLPVRAQQGLSRQNHEVWHTLVTEAISSNKSWDEIKDLLRLKLCNADIHTYTSWFMEIQQWEKESLTAYVHQFKTEAKRCNFTKVAATIRIFIKGLKNTHSLATHIYKKGQQMINDAISDIEKLNTVQ